MPTTPSGEQVGSTALFAENVALRESLAELLALYDGFKDGDITHEEAYYSFYKGEYGKWEKARNLLANGVIAALLCMAKDARGLESPYEDDDDS